MQGMILAAGMGKRLKDLTKDNTKCMVKVNGVSLIERMLSQLDQLNLSRIVIVVGYKGDLLKSYIQSLDVKTPITYVENPIYDQTNNIYSLFLARDYLCQADTLLLESDLIFEDTVLNEIVNDPRDSLALVDKYESWMDGTVVRLRSDDSIYDFTSSRKMDFSNSWKYYKTVNIYKFSKKFSEHTYVPFLEAYCQALGRNEYYEQVLKVITMLENPGIYAKRLPAGSKWYEIDDAQDLDIAQSIFAKPDDQLSLVQGRFGGFWRYPKMLDFCYLVNPYYPPAELRNEIRANFDKLLTQYPSGQNVNALLAEKYFGVRQEYVVVGNGAAELINLLMAQIGESLGVILPTFEEYRNKFAGKVVAYDTKSAGYEYDAANIMDFFDGADITALILINPDNPSGNYLPKQQLMQLLEWSLHKNIYLVIDESFVDFADQPESLLDNGILGKYPNLIIVKSLSKAHGVPGLRLGVLATADTAVLAYIREHIAIWNINAFAEYYLQIAEKYKVDYELALEEFRKEKRQTEEALMALKKVRVLPTQANYFMLELLNGQSAHEVATRLYRQYDILVKDLSAKLDSDKYLRVAIRDRDDNERLIDALKEVLQ